MSEQVWGWLFTLMGGTSLLLAGPKINSVWGWWVSLIAQAFWLAYAFVFQQWGFIANAAVYASVSAYNIVTWPKEDQ